jgi:hypothetical protein
MRSLSLTLAVTGLLLAVGCGPPSPPVVRSAARSGEAAVPPASAVETPPEARPEENAAATPPPAADPAGEPAVPGGTENLLAAGDAPPAAAPPRQSPASAGPERTEDVNFDDLKFDIERDAPFDPSLLTDAVKKLDGKLIRVRGFISPATYQLKGITQFVLLRDNQQCCFGPGAYIYHNMMVEMEEGKSTSYVIRPITVEGRFSIKPWVGPDGKTWSIYHVRATSAR